MFSSEYPLKLFIRYDVSRESDENTFNAAQKNTHGAIYDETSLSLLDQFFIKTDVRDCQNKKGLDGCPDTIIRTENHFITSYQQLLNARHYHEISLFPELSAVNLLHFVKERPACMELKECRLLINQVLLSGRGGIPALRRNDSGIYEATMEYIRQNKVKYELLRNTSCSLYAYTLESRVHSMVGNDIAILGLLKPLQGLAAA